MMYVGMKITTGLIFRLGKPGTAYPACFRGGYSMLGQNLAAKNSINTMKAPVCLRHCSSKTETSSAQKPPKKEEAPTVVSVPWYQSVFLRDHVSQTYNESHSIDFLEESHSDYHIPLKFHEREIAKRDEKIEKLYKELGYAESQLAVKDSLLAVKDSLLANERAERLKDIVFPALREEFSEFEQLHMPAVKLTRNDLVADIQRTDPSFVIPSTFSANSDLSHHYLVLRYILKNGTEQKVVDFKVFLNQRGYSDDFIARIGAIFYKKASEAVHNVLENMSLSEVISALRKKGINDVDLLTVAATMYAVKHNKLAELKDLEKLLSK